VVSTGLNVLNVKMLLIASSDVGQH